MSGKPKNMKGPQNMPPVPHPESGDDGEHSEAESEEPMPIYPENIHKRLNALKNIHMDIQKIEQELHMRMFQVEAELHKKMEPLLKKRNEIVSGAYEPNENESSFKLKEDEPQPETIPSNGETGIPKFWLTVLGNNIQASSLMEPHDDEVLEYLRDVRSVYTEKPLGFKIEFEFAENPFFANTVLTRTYEFDDNVSREDLYLNSGLSPKSTSGTVIEWKEGKDVTKKVVTSFQRNKKTNERRQVKSETDRDSFFKFFAPVVTDLAEVMKPKENEEDLPADDHQKNIEKIQTAEMEYEFASNLRTHVIPRALLIFTQEDEDEDYEDDFDDEEDDDDEAEEDEDDEEGQGDQDQEESEDDEVPAGKGGKKTGGGGMGNGRAGGIGKAGKPGKH